MDSDKEPLLAENGMAYALSNPSGDQIETQVDGKCIVECRNCHEEGPRSSMIAPCLCSGSIKWVHRSCLDEWRAVSPNTSSFSQCDVCHFDYQMTYDEPCFDWGPIKFTFLISRDFLILLAIVNTVTTLFSVLLYLINALPVEEDAFNYLNLPILPDIVMYWIAGWLLFFFCLGIFGIVVGFMWICNCLTCCTAPEKPTYHSYHYGWGGYYFYAFWWPYPITYDNYHHHNYSGGGCGNCNCSGGSCSVGNCNGGGGGGNDSGLLVVLLIIVIVIIVVGIIVGVILIILFGIRVADKHIHVLRARHKAGHWIVTDLDAVSTIN